jgi:polynucleotide 5'-hydroxyl-kinase GRC3/NOL9
MVATLTWRAVSHAVESEGAAVMVLGDVDTGKTTFCAYLLGKLSGRGRTIAFIDGDVGQSTVGPPGTVSLSMIEGAFLSLRYLKPVVMRFFGDLSPSGHITRAVSQVGDLADLARSRGARTIVLDTTGLYHGPEGTELKARKVERVKPAHLVVIQRDPPSEACTAEWMKSGARVFWITPAPCVQKRGPTERAAYRQRCFARYFGGATQMRIALDDTLLPRCQAAGAEDRLCGLLVGLVGGNGDMLALGVAQGLVGADLVTIAPAVPARELVHVELGSCLLDLKALGL